jgi:hypothetical protein
MPASTATPSRIDRTHAKGAHIPIPVQFARGRFRLANDTKPSQIWAARGEYLANAHVAAFGVQIRREFWDMDKA